MNKRNTLQGGLDKLQAQLERDQEAPAPLAEAVALPTRAPQLNVAACNQK